MKVVRVLAPNPGPYTGPGTNTYVLHDGEHAAVLDPGPIIASHTDAIRAALGELAPAAVIVTHNHSDHAPLANPLAEMLGVPAYGIGSVGGNFYGPNEWVDVDDLVNLVAVLVATMRGWSA